MMYQIRFHKANSKKHYNFWQIKHPDGLKTYHDPSEYNIIMTGVTFKNRLKMALKIFRKEQDKGVCAWMVAETLVVVPATPVVGLTTIEYNPHVSPQWTMNGFGADNHTCENAQTFGRQVFV